MIIKYFFQLFFLCSFMVTSIFAHQTALSYLELKTNSDMSVDIIIKKPLQDMRSDDLKIEFPRSCHDVLPDAKVEKDGFIVVKRSLWCGEDGLEGSTVWIKNLLESDRGVIFQYGSVNKLLTAYEPYVLIRKSTDQNPSLSYLWLGVEHILLGIDHLLFVLALLLLVSNIKVLIQTITAFTIAHSITLGFAILGYIQFSVLYIEAMIALSIVFLARELLMKAERENLSYKYPWIIAFVFGLFHGLGFASALFEVGLPLENIALSLLFFNLGVEFGQLMFIFTVFSMIWIFKKLTFKYHQFSRKTTAYLIGIAATYWFIERSLLLF